jgi:hypothetical protein
MIKEWIGMGWFEVEEESVCGRKIEGDRGEG